MQGNFVKTTYLDVMLEPDREWQVETPVENTVFIYIVQGSLAVDGTVCESRRALLFDRAEKLALTAGSSGVRFLLLSAKPLNEPIAWAGPIVMNTRAELERAFREIEDGTFVKDCKKAYMDSDQ